MAAVCNYSLCITLYTVTEGLISRICTCRLLADDRYDGGERQTMLTPALQAKHSAINIHTAMSKAGTMDQNKPRKTVCKLGILDAASVIGLRVLLGSWVDCP